MSKQHKREWNRRFYVNSGALHPLQTPTLQRIRLQNSRKLATEVLKYRSVSSRTPLPQEIANSFQLLKLHVEIEWERIQVPRAQRKVYYTLVFTQPPRKASKFLKKELRALENDESVLQLALEAVEARERSLRSIQGMVNYLTNTKTESSLEAVSQECADILHAHRLLTLTAVEAIAKWRTELAAFSGQVPAFLVDDQDYLLKLAQDLDLSRTVLAEIFPITDDPFLQSIAVGLSPELVHRIEFAQQVLRTVRHVQKPWLTVERLPRRRLLSSLGPSKTFVVGNSDSKIYRFMEKITQEMPAEIASLYVLDSVLDSCIHQVSAEAAAETVHYFVEMDVLDGLLDVISEIVEEVIEEERSRRLEKRVKFLLAKVLYEEFVDSQANEVISTTFFEVVSGAKAHAIEYLAIQTYRDLLEELTAEVADEAMAKAKRTEAKHKARNLQNYQLAQVLLRQLIEAAIEEAKLNTIADEFLSQVLTVKKSYSLNSSELMEQLDVIETKFFTHRLAERVYRDLISQFLNESWLTLLCKNMLVYAQKPHELVVLHPEDYADDLFTPGIHSPAAYSVHSEQSNQSMNLDFAAGLDLTDLQGLYFQPFDLPDRALRTALNEYYAFTKGSYQEVLLRVDELLTLTEANNTCWYWGCLDSRIVGLLVFIWDSTATTMLHVSCVAFRLVEDFIQKACSFIWDTPETNEIRVCFRTQVFKRVLSKLGFKWRAQTADTLTMGTLRAIPPTHSSDSCIQIQSAVQLHTVSEAFVPTHEFAERANEVGNRLCLLSAILQFASDPLVTPDFHHTRLHQDMSELLEIVLVSGVHSYPGITSSLLNASDSTSALHLSLSLVACSGVQCTINGQSVRCIHIRTGAMISQSIDSIELLKLPTESGEYSIVCIRYPGLIQDLANDLQKHKTDVYYRVQSILETQPSYKHSGPVTLPQFSKTFADELGWTPGYPITTAYTERFIRSAQHSGSVSMTLPVTDQVVPKQKAWDSPFLFAVVHRSCELPLFVGLVTRRDWRA